MGGTDNSYYPDRLSLSGTEGSHYAAWYFFQDATINESTHTPPVSITGLNSAARILQTRLRCQEVLPHVKAAIRPILPHDMMLHPENKVPALLL